MHNGKRQVPSTHEVHLHIFHITQRTTSVLVPKLLCFIFNNCGNCFEHFIFT